MIKEYHLDINDYPSSFSFVKKATIYWLLREKKWYGAEEYFSLHNDMLGFLVEILGQKTKNKDIAWSILHRNDLMKNELFNLKEIQTFLKKNSNYKFQMIPNPIFEKDAFDPLEENLGNTPKGTHLNLRDFGVCETDVIFVDQLNDKFYQAKNSLQNASIVL